MTVGESCQKKKRGIATAFLAYYTLLVRIYASKPFGVIIRMAGLALILLGGYNISTSVFIAMTPERHHSMGLAAAVLDGLFFAAPGFLLLRGASRLIKFSYPLEVSHREAAAHSVGLDSEL